MLLNVIVVLTIPFLIIAVHRAGISLKINRKFARKHFRCNSSQLSVAGRPVGHVFYACHFCEVTSALVECINPRCRFILFYYQLSAMPLAGSVVTKFHHQSIAETLHLDCSHAISKSVGLENTSKIKAFVLKKT